MKLQIRAIRQAQRMTIQELAETTGLGYITIIRYETGARMPKFDDAVRIANALGVQVTDLIERKVPR